MKRKQIRHLALFLSLLLASFAHAEVVAIDNADNDPYPVTGFLPGDNGGAGFESWEELEVGTPGSMYLSSSIDNDSSSWGIDGTYALGRELSQPLAIGSWNFLAQHDADNQNFSGFNLKTSANGTSFTSDEIFRIGMDPNQIGYDTRGVYVSTNAGADYLFLDCGWVDGEGDTIEYTIGWDTFAGSYTLAVSNQTESVAATFSGSLASGTSIAQLGVAVFGAGTDESIAFDAYTVIPEPRVFGSLVFSVLTMGFLRKRFLI
ncbi:MAG: hypothetical protein KAU94_04795 [Verrucomicrobia bacterium]|nr:hypothetical protein [Verrucomicrobiota bacterium]